MGRAASQLADAARANSRNEAWPGMGIAIGTPFSNGPRLFADAGLARAGLSRVSSAFEPLPY